MGRAEIVGGVSLAALAVILALSWTDDGDSGTVESTGGTAFVWEPPSTSAAAPTSSVAPSTSAPDAATDDVVSTSASSPVTAEEETASTETPPPATSVPETVPAVEVDVAAVRLRVLNVGAPPGAAGEISAALEAAGFAPLTPRDGPDDIDLPARIIHGEGQEAAAAAVASTLSWEPDVIGLVEEGDANWREFGSDVDLLVLIGPR